MGKEEIAGYKQFLLIPKCFQKTFTADTQKPGLFWEGVNLSQSKILSSGNGLKETEENSPTILKNILILVLPAAFSICKIVFFFLFVEASKLLTG